MTAQFQPFVLHTSELNSEGCPVDPRSPVSPPWDSNPSGGQSQNLRLTAPQAPAGGGRMSEVGQMLSKWGRNPDLRPYEELFRVEPNDAWFDLDRDPSHPTQFEIGTIRPGTGQSIILFDYKVTPFTFSGVTPFDYEELLDNEISGSFGYVLTINNTSPGPLRYRLQPVSSTMRNQAARFNESKMKTPGQLTEDDFQISQANDFASAAGYGTAVHPQNRQHYGARNSPFSEFVHDDSVITVSGVIFRPVELPIAFVECIFSGYQCSAVTAKQIETDLKATLR